MYDGRGLRGRWSGRDCRCEGGGGRGSFCDASASIRNNPGPVIALNSFDLYVVYHHRSAMTP